MRNVLSLSLLLSLLLLSFALSLKENSRPAESNLWAIEYADVVDDTSVKLGRRPQDKATFLIVGPYTREKEKGKRERERERKRKPSPFPGLESDTRQKSHCLFSFSFLLWHALWDGKNNCTALNASHKRSLWVALSLQSNRWIERRRAMKRKGRERKREWSKARD